ncbi:MAG: hypothetical protein ACREDQ_09450 [Limisphaerales bacterium]
MKRNNTNQNANDAEGGTTLKGTCLASCRKILARIAVAREMIFNESRQILKVHEHLLRLALNEAEAAAWQTMYPHLVFPTLASEKVQAVIAWDAKRQALQRARPAF